MTYSFSSVLPARRRAHRRVSCQSQSVAEKWRIWRPHSQCHSHHNRLQLLLFLLLWNRMAALASDSGLYCRLLLHKKQSGPSFCLSVCLSVCLLVTFVSLQKRLNRSRCRLGSELGGLKEARIRWGQGRTNLFAAAGLTRRRCGRSSKFLITCYYSRRCHRYRYRCRKQHLFLTDLLLITANNDKFDSLQLTSWNQFKQRRMYARGGPGPFSILILLLAV